MKIRFPSGKISNYNHSLLVIKGLISAHYHIYPDNQIYIYRESILNNQSQINLLPDEAIIDLVIVSLKSYAICNYKVKKIVEKLSYIPLTTPESEVSNRDLTKLNIRTRFYNGLSILHNQKERQDELSDIVSTFYDSFNAYSTKRRISIKEELRSVKSKTIIISTFNSPYIIMFNNFLASLKENGIGVPNQLLIFPMDEESQKVCVKNKIKSVYVQGGYGPTTSVHGNYGDRDFRTCMFMKNAIVKDILDLGYNVLFMDMDMVWFKNPIEHLIHLANLNLYDFMFMYDGVNNRFQPLYYNSGFFYVRNTDFSIKTWNKIFLNYDKIYHYGSQQVVVNIILNQFRQLGVRSELLDPTKFINGHQITPGKIVDFQKTDPYVVHASWTDGVKNKIRNLKEQGLWFLSDPAKN